MLRFGIRAPDVISLLLTKGLVSQLFSLSPHSSPQSQSPWVERVDSIPTMTRASAWTDWLGAQPYDCLVLRLLACERAQVATTQDKSIALALTPITILGKMEYCKPKQYRRNSWSSRPGGLLILRGHLRDVGI